MRKITVNDRQYLWVSGRTMTKVIDVEAKKAELFKNEEWGTPRIDCGFNYRAMTDQEFETLRCKEAHLYIIAPGDVRGMILRQRRWKDHPCKHHPEHMVTGLTTNPYTSEIYDRHDLMHNCPKCVTAVAENI